MSLEDFIAQCLPSQDEFLTMAAEGIWPPPSILDTPERAQVIWDGLATVRGLLEAYPADQWSEIFPLSLRQRRLDKTS